MPKCELLIGRKMCRNIMLLLDGVIPCLCRQQQPQCCQPPLWLKLEFYHCHWDLIPGKHTLFIWREANTAVLVSFAQNYTFEHVAPNDGRDVPWPGRVTLAPQAVTSPTHGDVQFESSMSSKFSRILLGS